MQAPSFIASSGVSGSLRPAVLRRGISERLGGLANRQKLTIPHRRSTNGRNLIIQNCFATGANSTRTINKPVKEKVTKLRELIRTSGLSAYIIPSEDAHMSEYIAECDRRRHYITEFTGSAGIALITAETGYCWTDARYFVQAAQELDSSEWTLMKQSIDASIEEWISEKLPKGSVIGVDSATMSIFAMNRMNEKLKNKEITLKPLPSGENLIDKVWGDERPPSPTSEIFIHDVKFAGMKVREKLELVKKEMKENNCALHIVAALDEVAWLLNLRGSDITFNPVFWSYVTVSLDGPTTLYVNSERFGEGVAEMLKNDGIQVRPYDAIMSDLSSVELAKDCKVWVDPKTCNVGIYEVLKERTGEKAVQIMKKMGPIQILKATKNEIELRGMRECHVRDGSALVKFLCWLEEEVTNKGKEITECEAAKKLDGLRSRLEKFVSLSFPTISSSGSNGAIIHYSPNESTCAKITRNDMYLVDSGAQYYDGTTDVTRTIHMGTPTEWQRRCFTRVLRGHIAVQRSIFPKGTTGNVLDAFARAPLWEDGLEFGHGTGHGVGSFLAVHEGPHVLSFKASAQNIALRPGFLTSNEPGYYEEGEFGIRIENICVVEQIEGLESRIGKGKGKPFYKLANLTYAPIQAKLVDLQLLTSVEEMWLDTYNQKVYDTLKPLLQDDETTAEWLWKNTRPVREQQREVRTV